VGDTANIRVPQGEIELEITSISYDIWLWASFHA
jgi:hypothetical protein